MTYLAIFDSLQKSNLMHITDSKLSIQFRLQLLFSLREAGKDIKCIKLQSCWLSDYFLVYLGNTDMIMIQHNKALEPAHQRVIELAIHC